MQQQKITNKLAIFVGVQQLFPAKHLLATVDHIYFKLYYFHPYTEKRPKLSTLWLANGFYCYVLLYYF